MRVTSNSKCKEYVTEKIETYLKNEFMDCRFVTAFVYRTVWTIFQMTYHMTLCSTYKFLPKSLSALSCLKHWQIVYQWVFIPTTRISVNFSFDVFKIYDIPSVYLFRCLYIDKVLQPKVRSQEFKKMICVISIKINRNYCIQNYIVESCWSVEIVLQECQHWFE